MEAVMQNFDIEKVLIKTMRTVTSRNLQNKSKESLHVRGNSNFGAAISPLLIILSPQLVSFQIQEVHMARTAAQQKKSIYGVHPGVLMTQKWIADLKQKTGRSLDEWLIFVKKSGPKTENERRE